MSSVACFIVESYQGSFIPVQANIVRIDAANDCFLEPLAYATPYVLLEQAQEFLMKTWLAHATALVYPKPIKMNPVGIKWLSEIESVQ